MSDDTRERSRHAARDASAPPNGSDGNSDMFQPDGHLNAEMVSAWLDTPDDFDADQRAAIEAHLAGCAECSQVAAELTAIVRAFQKLPLVEVPRTFALTPEMAGIVPTPTLPSSRRAEPVNLRDRTRERDARPAVGDSPLASAAIPWYERQMSALRWATAVAALLFVFVFSADLLGNVDTNGSDGDSAMVTDTDMPISTGAEDAGQPESESTPSGALAMPEEESDAEDDSARSAAETPVEEEEAQEEAAGSGPAEDDATGGGTSRDAEPTAAADEQQNAPPGEGDDESTSDDTMMTTLTEEPTPSNEEAFLTEAGPTIAQYNAQQAASEEGESSLLHILELALVIIIAWLLVAMIALPRLRRPGA